MQFLSQGIRHASVLSELILNNCNIKPTPEIFEIFSEGVFDSNSLRSLSFCNNHLTIPASATWVANLITFNSNRQGGLIDLNLSGNDLSLMMPPLAHVLRNNISLLNLNLSNCKMSHEGLSLLSNALVNIYIKFLKLKY